MSVAERFWAKVAKGGPDECWLWTGSVRKNGYGRFRLDGRTIGAHRVAYELEIGPIPDGKEIDHVRDRGCTSRACVNPAHLEPVTHRANVRRGRAGEVNAARQRAKTHCPKGHPYSGDNLMVSNGRRYCRICNRAAWKRWRSKTQEEVDGA